MPDYLNISSPGMPHSLRYNPSPQGEFESAGLQDGVTASSRNRTEAAKNYNGTGYYVENDEADPNFTDLQTLFLACFATLVPLILSVITAFVVRILWRKYRRNRDCRSYDGVLHQDESSDHLSGAPLHAHLLNSDKVKSCESQFSITADEIACSGSPVLYSGSSSRTNHASANGSIITMTLKNNHLIVETEERNDSVFVVEVQQGVRRDGPNTSAMTPVSGSYAAGSEEGDQRAVVHNPPERFSEDDKLEEVDEEYYPETTSPGASSRALKSSSTNTGLSQSTLSVTSNDPNPYYQYGNQTGYDLGFHGYPIYNGYINDDPLPTRVPDNKPKITSAIYKQNGRLVSMHSIEGGGLSSDKYAKLNNRVEFDEKEDAIQEEQRRLGNTPHEQEGSVLSKVKEGVLIGEAKIDSSPTVDGQINGKEYETSEKK